MHDMPLVSRRRFLRTAGSLIAGTALAAPVRQVLAAARGEHVAGDELDFIEPRIARIDLWGRITAYGTPVRASTGIDQPVADWLPLNAVVPLFEEVHATGNNPLNDLWYRTRSGYVYTPTVQPMKPYRTPEIITGLNDEFGVWAEVTVPFTIARTLPAGLAATLEDGSPHILYHASVHRVIGVEEDRDSNRWYKLYDDKPGAPGVFVPARYLRIIKLEDLAPISPGADKRVVVTLDEQRIDCYENDTLVFSTLISSGGKGFDTPRGEWFVVLKQPSRHMYSDPEDTAFSDPNFYDLPGVPFATFFTTMGHAIHGTYWHGDYGRPRSSGCLNATPEAARWIYRWIEPVAPYNSDFVPGDRSSGTPVIVV